MTKKRANARAAATGSSSPVELVLFGLILCILALRATYTEAPVVQTLTLPNSLTDALYTVTISGLLAFSLVFWLLWRILAGRFHYRVTGIEVGLAVFCLGAVVSTVGASDKRVAINHVMMLLGPIFAALLLAQILNSLVRRRLLLMVVATLGVVSAYQCAEQLFISNQATIEQYEKAPEQLLGPLGIEPGSFQHFLFEHRLYSRGVRGFFTTSNSAASFAILASFAAAILLAGRLRRDGPILKKVRRNLPSLVATLIVLIGLFLTKSKGGILAFFLGAALLALGWRFRRRFGAHPKRTAVLALLVGGVILAGVFGAAISYGFKHGRLPGGNSMLVRWQYWTASAQMYADHPFTGVGPGNFTSYYPHYKPAAALESVADPHDFVLSLLAQFGPLGLIGFLMMVFVPVWRSFTSLTVAPPLRETSQQGSLRRSALATLFVLCASLLLIRPALIPRSGDGGLDMLVYEVTTVYVTPVAVFLIGFLLLALPFEEKAKQRRPDGLTFAVAALSAAILAVLAHNLIDFAIFEPGVWTTFWAFLALLVAGSARPQMEAPTAIPVSSYVKAVALVVTFALLAGYYGFAWRPVHGATVNMQRAQQAMSFGRFDEAHRFLAAASAADPLSPAPLTLNGRLYVEQYAQTGREHSELLKKADHDFQRAIDLNPADYKNYEKLGIVRNQLGQPRQAYNWYLKAVALYPGSGRLWFDLAQVAQRLGMNDQALKDYRKAVEIEDRYRRQFHEMYPKRTKIVSRLGEKKYRLAQERIRELSK